jgi:hypothetical protein
VHPDQALVESYRHWFYGAYAQQLNSPAAQERGNECTRDILDIWIYTQAIHAGKRQDAKGRSFGRFTLADFDAWANRIGREKFEFLFRGSLRSIGYLYVQFSEKLAAPLFRQLERECGMRPGFEASAALKYNPYPDLRYRITFDDVFWHLDKESVEETFERLLARQTYAALESLFRGYFENKAAALTALCEYEQFGKMLEGTGGRLLQPDDAEPSGFLCSHGASYGAYQFAPIKFELYKGRKLRCFNNTDGMLAAAYTDFRNCLFEERRRQKKERWRPS